ncbi:MAG TPA: hypothetical protein VFH73_00305, partial [Polyangia bacterium]|nr:hypothetical protein [Polyangia bacterium]
MRKWLAVAIWGAAAATGALAVTMAAGCGPTTAVPPATKGPPTDGSAGEQSSADAGAGGASGGSPGAMGGTGGGAGAGLGDAGPVDIRDTAASATTDTGGQTPSRPCPLPAIPQCDAPSPDPGAKQAWRHTGPSALGGAAQHRGRDLFVGQSGPQWLIARFAYGLFDAALTDENVDIYLLRGCGATWEKLGTALTSQGQHAAVEGVDDNSGRVFYEIPADKKLGLGRHRARFVVTGDLSFTEAFVEVVAPGTPLFVADVDGTLTTDEAAELNALLTGTLPNANPDAADALKALVAKGYRPLYLTARAEGLTERTHRFLSERGFPAGIVNTTSAGAVM